MKKFFRYIAKKVFKEDYDLQFVDSTDIAVCRNRNVTGGYKRFWNNINKWFKASKNEYFTGIKHHMFLNKEGHPVNFGISKASVPDLNASKKIKTKEKGITYVNDKAYIDEDYNQKLQSKYNQQIITPTKSNQKVKNSKYAKKLLKERQKSENGFSVMKEFINFGAKECKNFYGLIKTITLKTLSFSFLTWVNKVLNRPLFSYLHLV